MYELGATVVLVFSCEFYSTVRSKEKRTEAFMKRTLTKFPHHLFTPSTDSLKQIEPRSREKEASEVVIRLLVWVNV